MPPPLYVIMLLAALAVFVLVFRDAAAEGFAPALQKRVYATWWTPFLIPRPSTLVPNRGWVKVGEEDLSFDNIQSLGVVGRGRTPVVLDGELLDYRVPKMRQNIVAQVRGAGVTVMIADCTNSFWGSEITRLRKIMDPAIAEMRAAGIKFAVAVGYHGVVPALGSDDKPAKNGGQDTGRMDVDAAEALLDAFPNDWFTYMGKPVVVLYASKSNFDLMSKMSTRFTFVNGAGSDGCPGGKGERGVWGWQLGSKCGTAPSSEVVFVSPSLKVFRDNMTAERYNAKYGTTHATWKGTKVIKGHDKHRSAAWLDFNFSVAAMSAPKIVVVGAIDDLAERNGWGLFDTASVEPGLRTYDTTGAVTINGLYDRVKAWTSTGAAPPPVGGKGVVPEGFYSIQNKSGEMLWIAGNDLRDAPPEGNPASWSTQVKGLSGVFALYHVGDNQYRIVAVNGLALTKTADKSLIQNPHTTGPEQRFAVSLAAGGLVNIKGLGSAMKLVPFFPAVS
jgi:hypothetical protein